MSQLTIYTGNNIIINMTEIDSNQPDSILPTDFQLALAEGMTPAEANEKYNTALNLAKKLTQKKSIPPPPVLYQH